jgi:hypothetical protein
MAQLEDFEHFHDWYIEQVTLGKDLLMLRVRLYDRRASIEFQGATRCLMNDFLLQNIIYEIVIASPEGAAKARETLDGVSRPLSKRAHNLALLTASVGAEIIVEFSDLVIREE